MPRIPTQTTASEIKTGLHRRTALKLPVLLTAAAGLSTMPVASAKSTRWSEDRAARWYREHGWVVGANFIPSNAVNQFEMFQPDTYDPKRIDTELRMARRVGLNAVRVFLHDQLWLQDRAGFHRRLAQFVAIAARHRIKPLFVFFDSCWDPHPKLGRQAAPRAGIHNSRWVQSPGAERLDDRYYRQVMQDYVTAVMTQFRYDERVLGWDLWNEPDNPAPQYRAVERSDKIDLVATLLPQVFRWARSINAIQPLTSGVWDGPWGDPATRSEMVRIQLDNSDVVTFHSYANPAEFESRLAELAPQRRPMMCTEYLARTLDSTVAGILPVAKRRNVGAFSWGFVAGKTQTYLPWDSWERPYLDPPQEWFHDLLLPDGQPYRVDEAQTIRRLTGPPVPK